MTIARSVTVAGLVQGVFFRVWTKGQADALGVSGWVRNRPDGTVEAHVEGEGAAVDALVEAMRHGPGGARVERVTVVEAGAEGGEGFSVRH